MFTLSKNEFEIMSLLWKENKPLSRTEIIELSPDKTWKPSSVHILLNSLLDKEAIQVDGFVRTGKNYGRTYSAALTQEEYATMQFTQNMPTDTNKNETLADFIAALIQKENVDKEVLNKVQEAIDRKKETINK